MKDNIRISPLHRGDYYTEGPAVDRQGNIYFTTLTGGKIMRIDTTGVTSVWAESACPNGQRVLSNGDHLVCDSQQGKVVRFDANGQKIGDAAAGTCDDVPIRTPNDLTVDEEAGFYFTDSVRHDGVVYFFDYDGRGKVVASDLDYPNGICLSRDRTKLFIAESYKNRIVVVTLQEPGISSGPAEVFCELPWNPDDRVTGNLPDGILLDADENLWIAHYGMGTVQVVAPSGKLMKSLKTGIPLTSNLVLAGEDARNLIVTGGSGEPGPGSVHMLSFA